MGPMLRVYVRRRGARRLGIHQSIRASPIGSASVNRQCSRPGCAESAVATLTYQYARSVAWLDELSEVRDPHGYDLCERHAERLRVPHGWRLEERRPFYAPGQQFVPPSRWLTPSLCSVAPRASRAG